jgi:hypothetical protein
MERSLFDTVSMLGLDIMLAVSATLAVLSALIRVVQRWRERMSADETGDERRAERHERPAAGYAPPLSIGLIPHATAPAVHVVPAWIEAWMRRDPERDAAATLVASPPLERREESREHEVA